MAGPPLHSIPAANQFDSHREFLHFRPLPGNLRAQGQGNKLFCGKLRLVWRIDRV
jgi:hypothetical protein